MTLNVQNGVRLTTFSGINVESNGILQLSGGTLDAQFVEIFGGTLRGSGLITTGSGSIPGQVESRGGTVSPGNGVGSLSVIGRFANDRNGTMAFDLGGTTAGQFDSIAVTGSAALDGTLAVSLINGFNPTAGNIFTILTATEDIGGVFDNLIIPDGVNMHLNYLANSLQLQVGNAGDFNFDNTVDAADYVIWRNNGWGPLNYSTWRSHIGMTYGSGAAVPEPAAVTLVVLSACGFACRRRARVTRPVRSAA